MKIEPSARALGSFSESEQQRSARVRLGGAQLIRTLPGTLHLLGRAQPYLERAVAGDPLELSIATGELPCTFDGDLAPTRLAIQIGGALQSMRPKNGQSAIALKW